MKRKLFKNLLSVVILAIVVLAIIEVFKLDVLPDKYLYLFLAGEFLLFLIGFLLYNRKNKILLILGILFYLITVLGNVFGYYSLSKINKYIDTSFVKEYYLDKTTYYVITSKNNLEVNNLDEVDKQSKILYYKYSKAINEALKQLGEYTYQDKDTALGAMTEVINENSYFLIAKADYNYFFTSTNIHLIQEEEVKIIHEFEVEEKVMVNTETPTSYNIYVNGLDFTGVMRDYNLIVTVNTKTRKVLLTSIPRDYYVDVPAYNMKDTLMCLGSLDSEVSKEALENLFNTKIDYTINLNTSSLVNIVDTIGGVEFCSDIAFKTTHTLTLDTYDDSRGQKLMVPKGCKTYNGIEILTIARERNAFPGRDRARQKNCRQILINIMKKIASTVSLNNYNEILSSFDGFYTTDMNEKVIKNLLKIAIEDMNFEILEQSVDGDDSIGIGHLGTQESWIMTPRMDTVYVASEQINNILNE